LLNRIKDSVTEVPEGIKTRCHGDYHLAQVLLKRNDFVIVDFEGEPSRTLAERRMKRSPLTDVAGMLRSFSYARQTALQQIARQSADDCSKWEPLLEEWERQTRQMFLSVYDEIACASGLYRTLEEMQPLLRLFELEKSLYEIRYELGSRPEWMSIPLRYLLSFAE
jgi:maltose alpha-D-glucosyltransferase/alpha-amylase